MAPYFFRVEHDLLRSESFKTLGGSAIKVYLVIGLYSDFGTDWAYPSIRTIARQAGLSRQTVLAAIAELTRAGLAGHEQVEGAVNGLQDHPPGPGPPPSKSKRRREGDRRAAPSSLGVSDCPRIFRGGRSETGPESLEVPHRLVQILSRHWPSSSARQAPRLGPKREPGTKEETHSIPIPGTPFRLSAEGRLLVAVDLQELLTNQGIPRRLAERLAAQKDPEDVAKVLLNAFYLQSQGKLQNGPGYIRAGLEGGYDLLPQVAHRLESRRRELAEQLRSLRGHNATAERQRRTTDMPRKRRSTW